MIIKNNDFMRSTPRRLDPAPFSPNATPKIAAKQPRLAFFAHRNANHLYGFLRAPMDIHGALPDAPELSLKSTFWLIKTTFRPNESPLFNAKYAS